MKRLDRIAMRSFWTRRERQRQRALYVSRLWVAARDRVSATSSRFKVARQLARQSVSQLVVGIGIYAAVRTLAAIFAESDWALLRAAGSSVTDDTFRDLLGAGVGALGALLGLYYATVGVVASTVYQEAPAPIRTLFVEDESGVVYVSGVVRALIFGICELTFSSIGPPASPIVLVAFALLAISSLLRLMILGGSIFNFFDPSALSLTLGKKLIRAIRNASVGPRSRDEGTQQAAFESASSALDTYLDLAILLEDRKGRSAVGPRRLTRQLISIASGYSSVKGGIPSASSWWERQPHHQNWMTLDHTRLEMTRLTETGVAPELKPDRTWFEKRVAKVLSRTLESAYRAGGSRAALTFADAIARIAYAMSSRMQIEEALILERVWANSVGEISASASVGEDAQTYELNKLAAAEQIVMPLIQSWLGFNAGLSSLVSRDLVALFDRTLSGSPSQVAGVFPQPTLELLEELAERSKKEKLSEGKIVTPDWWKHHMIARSIALHAHECLITFKAEVDGPLAAVADAHLVRGAHDLAAVVALASLELHHKIEFHLHRLREIFQELAALRNPGVGEPAWPDVPFDDSWPVALRRQALSQLITSLPHLRTDAHNPQRPDLYGQTFVRLFDATFDAILEGDRVLGVELFRAVFLEADRMRVRTARDLSKHPDPMATVAFAAEPTVGLMELSGYARLMQDVDGEGMWDAVRETWDAVLAGDHGSEAAATLISHRSMLESLFALTPGSISRTARLQQLARALKGRGIESTRWDDPFAPLDDGGNDEADQVSAIVDIFADSELGIHDDLADLFIVDYLASYLPEDVELPRGVEALRDSIEHASGRRRATRHRPATEPSAEGGNDETAS